MTFMNAHIYCFSMHITPSNMTRKKLLLCDRLWNNELNNVTSLIVKLGNNHINLIWALNDNIVKPRLFHKL